MWATPREPSGYREHALGRETVVVRAACRWAHWHWFATGLQLDKDARWLGRIFRTFMVYEIY